MQESVCKTNARSQGRQYVEEYISCEQSSLGSDSCRDSLNEERKQERDLGPMEGKSMTYVIQEPCVATKDTACVDVCPVDCIYEVEPKEEFANLPMFIHAEECIDCGACEPECPVDAIRIDDEAEEKWLEINAKLSEVHE